MHNTFTLDPLYIDDIVVYLKNERTGSSTVRKCKFIGRILEFTDTKVKIGRLSQPDKFVTPEECQDYGIDTVYPDDIVHTIISRHQLDNWLCLPHTIGDITFYDKKELVEWVENQQRINEKFQFTFKTDLSSLVNDCTWGAFDCSHLTDEEIDRIVDEFNKIPN